MIGLPAIARYATNEPPRTRQASCELCANPIGSTHHHVIELRGRIVQCACQACAVLFANASAESTHRTIPDRVRNASSTLTADGWAALGVPVSIAICYRDSARDHGIVCYPGPAGMTEAELETTAWDAIVAATPLAAQLEADVEGLLVRSRRGEPRLECYVVPISTAYELVARLRAVWEGFTGGERAEAELAAFFVELERRGRA